MRAIVFALAAGLWAFDADPAAATQEASPSVTGRRASPADVREPSTPGFQKGLSCEERQARSKKQREAFFAAQGGEKNLSAFYVKSLTAFLEIEDRVMCGDAESAALLIRNFFRKYPAGSEVWRENGDANARAFAPYTGLRMLEQIILQRRSGSKHKKRDITLTVASVGCSQGIFARNRKELAKGAGEFVTNRLDPRVLAYDNRRIHTSLALFSEYVEAISGGAFQLKVWFHKASDSVCIPASVEEAAGDAIVAVDLDSLWRQVPSFVVDSTDWWWVVYPSHRTKHPKTPPDVAIRSDRVLRSFRGAPVFVSDDRSLLEGPKTSPYAEAELRTHGPRWMQQFLMRYLFSLYPELKLESPPRKWEQRKLWPTDFDGTVQEDYFFEALDKRLSQAKPPFVGRLRQRPPKAGFFVGLRREQLVGLYVHHPATHPSDTGRILLSAAGTPLSWRDNAGQAWSLAPDYQRGVLTTGPTTPTHSKAGEKLFFLQPKRNDAGIYVKKIDGFWYNGVFYRFAEPVSIP